MSEESEADELGLEYLVNAGYDPREASGTFEQLLKEHGDPSKMDAFFYSSHPRNQERMERTTKWVEEKYSDRLATGTWIVDTPEYQEVVRTIVAAMEKPKE